MFSMLVILLNCFKGGRPALAAPRARTEQNFNPLYYMYVYINMCRG